MLRTPSVCRTPCLMLGMQAWSLLGTASVQGERQMVLQDTVRLCDEPRVEELRGLSTL